MSTLTLGQLVHDFFLDYLCQQKGLRQSSVRSYRDTLRLFLPFISKAKRRPISRLRLEDLTLESVLSFLQHVEQVRRNSAATRNQRLAALRTFFEYLVRRSPDLLHLSQQIANIPNKRAPRPETRFIARDDVQALFHRLPGTSRLALRDRALLTFLYNTGARAQEAADLRVEHLTLAQPPWVRLHGKGDKWRQCPLWPQTAELLQALLRQRTSDPHDAVFVSSCGGALTRFGIYKRVRLLTQGVQTTGSAGKSHCVSPHVWRHTAAVHLLESCNDINLVRGWLGHVDINTTHRYAEITLRMKAEAMSHCAPTGPTAVPWRDDPSLLQWLNSL